MSEWKLTLQAKLWRKFCSCSVNRCSYFLWLQQQHPQILNKHITPFTTFGLYPFGCTSNTILVLRGHALVEAVYQGGRSRTRHHFYFKYTPAQFHTSLVYFIHFCMILVPLYSFPHKQDNCDIRCLVVLFCLVGLGFWLRVSLPPLASPFPAFRLLVVLLLPLCCSPSSPPPPFLGLLVPDDLGFR